MTRVDELVKIIRGHPVEWLLTEEGIATIIDAWKLTSPDDKARLDAERRELAKQGKAVNPLLIDDTGQTFFTDDQMAACLGCSVETVCELREKLMEHCPELFSPAGSVHMLQ